MFNVVGLTMKRGVEGSNFLGGWIILGVLRRDSSFLS